MEGIEPSVPSPSEIQIAGKSYFADRCGARLDPGDAVLEGPQRLCEALVDPQLALPFLVQVARSLPCRRGAGARCQ